MTAAYTNAISRISLPLGETTPSGHQQLAEAIRRLESHPKYSETQLCLRKLLKHFDGKASPRSRVYGSKASLKRVLCQMNASAFAFLALVTDTTTQKDYITLLRYVESAAWNEYLGPTISEIRPTGHRPENHPIHASIEQWITISYQHRVRLEETPADGGRYEIVVLKGTGRRATVDAYIAQVFRETGRKITRKDIWQAAGYKARSAFERWERNDHKKPNKEAQRRFTQILASQPHLKNN